ncbi:FMN reductase [Nocardia sp. SYP-A9097]|uniref:NADPH-dependent FMN reductase n=1 Tax=Nocardia sp. SYP-A9097 TaxID=2663237 RepID=UPI00132AA253|nr:NAD(P)H-dependent oxidoreductase [Nocardia sp. SYP-A9097]MRH91779.1 FMN reductase [Nocardia sp. SYP-A9097]
MIRPRTIVCGLSGSLRQASWNRKLLRAMGDHAPGNIELRIFEGLDQVPLFNEDLLGDEPAGVAALRAAVAAADALMIATPEYNGGVPGVLKNALDWLSLPRGSSALHRKPVALVGATPGRLGTARSQFELRHTFIFTQSAVIPGPEVLLSFAHERFDADGRLTDPATVDLIERLWEELRNYTRLAEPEVVQHS